MAAASDVQGAPDLVTQLQREVQRLSELFFGTVGELQRDGVPLSLNGEPLVEPGHAAHYDAAARSKGFAKDLTQACANIRLLAQRLPDQPAEEQVLRSIAALQLEGEALRVQLQQEKAAAEAKLKQAQDMFDVLACSTYRQRQHAAAPAAPAPPAAQLAAAAAPAT